jgi:peptidoglycan/LPS O-acetylase OafA/YrhL
MPLPSHQEFLNTKFFNSLNGIRCLSIVAVIGFHHNVINLNQGITNFGLNQMFYRGLLGVDLFFVISGFLITTLLLREQQARGTISLKLFYARRILRIFPAYYTTLLFYVILVFLFEGNLADRREFFHNLPFFSTYTSNWFVESQTAIFFFAWSLATEEQFYLVWAQVLRFFRWAWGGILFAVSLIMLDQLINFQVISRLPFLPGAWDHYLMRILQSISTPICLGVLLAYGLNSKAFYERMIVLGHWLSSALFFAALLFCIYFPGELTPAWTLAIHLCMALFIGSCVYQEKHCLTRILSSRLFSEVGIVSYGMYLFHTMVLYMIHGIFRHMMWQQPYLELALCLISIFGLAYISYYHYESRFLKLKKYWVR